MGFPTFWLLLQDQTLTLNPNLNKILDTHFSAPTLKNTTDRARSSETTILLGGSWDLVMRAVIIISLGYILTITIMIMIATITITSYILLLLIIIIFRG